MRVERLGKSPTDFLKYHHLLNTIISATAVLCNKNSPFPQNRQGEVTVTSKKAKLLASFVSVTLLSKST